MTDTVSKSVGADIHPKTKHKKAVRSYERTADFPFTCVFLCCARCHFRTELTAPSSSTVFLRLQSELNLTVMCRSVSPMVDGQKVLSKKISNTLLAAPSRLVGAELDFQMDYPISFSSRSDRVCFSSSVSLEKKRSRFASRSARISAAREAPASVSLSSTARLSFSSLSRTR